MRSYVTSATTIRPMAETPAKIPKPMGRTFRLLPGITKAEADALAESAAADAVVEAALSSAAATATVAVVAPAEVSVAEVDAAWSAAAVADVADETVSVTDDVETLMIAAAPVAALDDAEAAAAEVEVEAAAAASAVEVSGTDVTA